MDVLEVIKSEHEEVAALLQEAEACEPGDQRLMTLAGTIAQKLKSHFDIEERLVYSKVRERAEETGERVDVFESYTEHEGARNILELIRTTRRPDERFKAEVLVLGENVRHHVEDEESKVWPIVRETIEPKEREALATSWERARKRADSAASSNGKRKKTSSRKASAKKSSTKKSSAKKSATRKRR